MSAKHPTEAEQLAVRDILRRLKSGRPLNEAQVALLDLLPAAHRARAKSRHQAILKARELSGEGRAEARRAQQRQLGNARTAWSQEIGEIPPPKDPARRAAALADFKEFLHAYFTGPDARFYAPFSKDHLRVIDLLQHTIRTGESCAVAMPRGSGKTSIIELAPVWAVLNGFWFFVPVVAANKKLAISILDSIKSVFQTNELFAEDFPEYVIPVKHIENEPRRCLGQHYQGVPTGIQWAPDHIRFAEIRDRGVKGGILWASGLTAALRGLRLTLNDGTLVRPDGGILDDPQTDKSARSVTQTAQRMGLIRGAIRYWPSPGKRLSVFAAVTVIQPHDLADRLLDPKETGWRVIRTKSLYAFPESMPLWFKYQEKRREEKLLGRLDDAANFYRANRAAMDAGAILAWPEKPLSPGYFSALQELMDAYLDDPDKFMAEHQQEPVAPDAGLSRISPEVVAKKVNGRPRGEVPPSCPFLVAYIDTHDRAFFWTVLAFEQSFKPYVVDYGAFPEQPVREFTLATLQRTLRRRYPHRTTDAAIFAGQDELVAHLYERRFKKGDYTAGIDLVLADTGYKLDLWQQTKTKHPRLVLTKGTGIKAGNLPMLEWQKRPGEVIGDHWITPPAKHREHPVTMIDVNHWKTVVIDAVAAAPGEPGSLTFFGDSQTVHPLFASHLDAEAFVETEGFGRKVVEWKPKPGKPDNHWFDCTVGCFVGASILGARPEGAPLVAQRGRVRRKYSQDDLMKRRSYAHHHP
jgi:hypothetical protein